ncbi:hypothetical protein AB6813_20700 [bacterium RCC_150]
MLPTIGHSNHVSVDDPAIWEVSAPDEYERFKGITMHIEIEPVKKVILQAYGRVVPALDQCVEIRMRVTLRFLH